MCYEHTTQKEIPISKYHQLLNIPKTNGEYIYGTHDLFALIIILKELLRKDDFHIMMQEITYELNYLSGRLHTIKINKILDKMGFPENYKDIVRMD